MLISLLRVTFKSMRSICFSSSPHLRLGFQRVPLLCPARQSKVRLAADGKPLHRQGGDLGRGQLHLRGDQQHHKGEGSQLSHGSDPQD